MPLAYLLRPPRPAVAGVLALAALLAGAALAGALPPLAAVTPAAAAACALAGIRLSRLAGARGGGRRDRRARHAAALLDTAVAIVGMTVAVLPLAARANRAEVATAGLVAAAVAYGGGLLALPGQARLAPAERLRRAVDMLALGAALAFAGRLLVPPGPVPPGVRVVTLAGAVGLAALGVSAVAQRRSRPGAALCRAGAAATLTGLAGLVALLAAAAPDPLLLTTVPPLMVGALLTAAGMTRVAAGDPPRGEGPARPWPRITAPAAVILLAALLRLGVVGSIPPDAVLLGWAAVGPLVGRELLAAADHRRRIRRLAAREAHFRALVTGGPDVVLLLDDELRVSWSAAAAARLGWGDDELRGRPLAELLHPDDAPAARELLAALRAGAEPPLLVARLAAGDGGWRETESTVRDQRAEPTVAAVVLHVREVAPRQRSAAPDPSPVPTDRTGRTEGPPGADRPTGFLDRAELLRILGVRRAEPGTLLLVDLHGFGGLDGEDGPSARDVAMGTAARRLRDVVGPRDLVARVSAEEFAVVTDAGPVPAYALGGQLLAALGEPCPVPDAMLRLRVSVGLAELAGEAPEDVLRQADLARRRAVQLGRNRVEWYDAYLEEQLVRRLDLERELPGAIARGELDLVYQPVLSLADRSPVGVEALLRWRSPVLGTVLPAELLPVAEELDLVGELGGWVLGRACRQLADWAAAGRQLWMSVNVTPRELLSPDFPARVSGALAGHAVPAERLVVEVAEPRVGAELSTVVARLAGLRSAGVRTALDDFRAEHASLARLRRLPVDLLKVRAPAEPVDGPVRPLLDVVVTLCDRLGLAAVAQELESEADLARAERAGCRYGQGFALARPATAERVEAYFAEFPSAFH
ncbi:putative bifunctional diguanylate cyclase/phosphodiesterase [Micromonospora sp. NPDC000089]|uniref:putative bifunctional diguanylate cyclase/phosphodiesterase n=1 Tax=unclassified Micromonospora TaxID=2617518 RepID=UPI00369279DE